MIVMCAIMLYPVAWMVMSSFKPNTEIFSDPGLIPHSPTLRNYVEGWTANGSFARMLLNSLLISLLSVAGNVAACSLAAYAFARLDFALRNLWFAVMLGTVMLPFQITSVPQYVLFSKLGWINTILPLVVPRFLATDAFFIFLMVQFIRSLPRDLDDAAKVDGCGPFGIFFRIVLPLLLPALATTAIFSFIWSWNDFLGPLLYLTVPDTYTVPIGLNSFLDSSGDSAWGQLFAMSTISLAPLFGFFIAAQKYLVQGIATTGIR